LTDPLTLIPLILFSIPSLTLLGMGLVILIKPISVINRRWYLAIFAPLLAANPLALLNNLGAPGDSALSGGDLVFLIGVILADLAIILGFALVFRGAVVHGLGEEETWAALETLLKDKGHSVTKRTGEKSFLWARFDEARILTVGSGEAAADIWIAESVREVVIRADSRKALQYLQTVLPELRKMDRPYRFKAHAMGVLYLVLALVFAILTWIYFFEPRLVLVN
jgi:hypothetical protein